MKNKPESNHIHAPWVRPAAISRRTVLRGLGTSLSLPILEAMTCCGAKWSRFTVPTGWWC